MYAIPKEARRGCEVPGAGVVEAFELLCRFLDPNLDPPQAQQAFLPTEPYLQTCILFFLSTKPLLLYHCKTKLKFSCDDKENGIKLCFMCAFAKIYTKLFISSLLKQISRGC